jgi:cell division protein FtsL
VRDVRDNFRKPADAPRTAGQAVRLVKITLLVSVVLLFCVTWQNVQIHLLESNVHARARIRNELENELYRKKLELMELESRDRIREIAVNELNMVPVTYRDVKVILY